jgi:hypothetical protein
MSDLDTTLQFVTQIKNEGKKLDLHVLVLIYYTRVII